MSERLHPSIRGVVDELKAIFPDVKDDAITKILQGLFEEGTPRDTIVDSAINKILEENRNQPDAPSELQGEEKDVYKEITTIFPDASKSYIKELIVVESRALPKGANKKSALMARATSLVLANPNGEKKNDSPKEVRPKDEVLINLVDPENDKKEDHKLAEEFDALSAAVAEVTVIFPDIDPHWVMNKLEEDKKDKNRVIKLTNHLLENRDYPKKKNDVISTSTAKSDLMTDLDTTDYYNIATPVTENYKDHALNALCNKFPYTPKTYVRSVLLEFGSHYLPALRKLEEIHKNLGDPVVARKKKNNNNNHFKWMVKPRDELGFPRQREERFFREMAFSHLEEKLKQEKEDARIAKELRMKEAEASGDLIECGCCFSDCLIEDMAQCSDGHLFCLECCRRAANEVIGKAKSNFPCLSSEGCKHEFPDSEVRRFLSSVIYQSHLKRKQAEEIRAANIEGLVGCPFCEYSTIMTNKDDKIFKCLNPACMKESCILCKELNHIPFRCEEVEKKDETALRTFIENQMTEALLRTCWKCKKRFYKTEGCNHMTCTCGSHMCYVCEKPLVGSWGNHYGKAEEGKCVLHSDTVKLNMKNVKEGAVAALEEYLEQHPEMSHVKLKSNPLEELTPKKKKPSPKRPHPKRRKV